MQASPPHLRRVCQPRVRQVRQPVHVGTSSHSDQCGGGRAGHRGEGPEGSGGVLPGRRGLGTCESRGGSDRTTACLGELLGVESRSRRFRAQAGPVGPSPPGPVSSCLKGQPSSAVAVGFGSSGTHVPPGVGMALLGAQALPIGPWQSLASQTLSSEPCAPPAGSPDLGVGVVRAPG